jgi:hypothetical protein
MKIFRQMTITCPEKERTPKEDAILEDSSRSGYAVCPDHVDVQNTNLLTGRITTMGKEDHHDD